MPTACALEPDLRFRYLVLRELDWDPEVNARGIDVTTSGGTVTLAGFIDSCAGKRAAECAVKRLRGVHEVVNHLVVQPATHRTDAELTHNASEALASAAPLPASLHVTAQNGVLILTGSVEWLFQRELAERLAAHVRGVVDVHNQIEVEPPSACVDTRRHILRAFHQLATLDARRLEVSVTDRTVTLTGTVHSWAEREAAEQAAARTEGVARIVNRIEVHSEPAEDEIG